MCVQHVMKMARASDLGHFLPAPSCQASEHRGEEECGRAIATSSASSFPVPHASSVYALVKISFQNGLVSTRGGTKQRPQNRDRGRERERQRVRGRKHGDCCTHKLKHVEDMFIVREIQIHRG